MPISAGHKRRIKMRWSGRWLNDDARAPVFGVRTVLVCSQETVAWPVAATGRQACRCAPIRWRRSPNP